LESAAQSLPELARQIRAERSELRTGPVFTNENIGQLGAVLANGSTTPDLANQAQQLEPVDVEAADTEVAFGGRTEQGWREAFEEARAEIGRSENLSELTRQELEDLNMRLLTESSLFNREGQLMPLITEKREGLEAAQQRIVDANQALDDLSAELRSAGGPAGWAR